MTVAQIKWFKDFQAILVAQFPETDDETFVQLLMLERVIQTQGRVPVEDTKLMARLFKAMEFYMQHASHLGGFPSES